MTPKSDLWLLFITGATNAGKSTFLNWVRSNVGQVGLVEVGKMMRAKYPPEYFQGQGAPAHTASEAWNMMLNRIKELREEGVKYILIDGQPRDRAQTEGVCAMRDYRKLIVNLFASDEVRLARAVARDKDNIPNLMLSIKRLQGDLMPIYSNLSVLLERGERVLSFDTGRGVVSQDFQTRQIWEAIVQTIIESQNAADARVGGPIP